MVKPSNLFFAYVNVILGFNVSEGVERRLKEAQ